jgi:hypothetical protein
VSETKQVKIVRRWGSHQPGETVEVDKTTATWLVGIRIAEDPNNPGTSRHTPLHASGNGVDQSAGGDPTRWRLTSFDKGDRGGNRAGRVQGAPKRVGDVSHVKQENLGREHGDNPNDVLLASGKPLSKDLEERQREADEADRKRSQASEEQRPAEGQQPQSTGQASGEQPQGAAVRTEQPKG